MYFLIKSDIRINLFFYKNFTTLYTIYPHNKIIIINSLRIIVFNKKMKMKFGKVSLNFCKCHPIKCVPLSASDFLFLRNSIQPVLYFILMYVCR